MRNVACDGQDTGLALDLDSPRRHESREGAAVFAPELSLKVLAEAVLFELRKQPFPVLR